VITSSSSSKNRQQQAYILVLMSSESGKRGKMRLERKEDRTSLRVTTAKAPHQEGKVGLQRL